MAKTTLAVATVLAAAATTAGAVQQDNAQRKSLHAQKAAQQQAQNQSLKQENMAETQMRKATATPPDLAALLASQAKPPGTILSRPVNPNSLTTSTLLGG